MKTSEFIRKAIDSHMIATIKQYYSNDEWYSSPYICDCLDEMDVATRFENAEAVDSVKELFIRPEIGEKEWCLFYMGNYLESNDAKGYFECQSIRFMFMELIACYYESIGD